MRDPHSLHLMLFSSDAIIVVDDEAHRLARRTTFSQNTAQRNVATVVPSAGDMRSPQTKLISQIVRSSNDRIATKSNSPTVVETLDNAEWYHGRLSRRNACELLQDNGDFLVRLARSKTDSLLKAVLSVRWNGRHYHFEIRERHGFFSVEDLRFDSIVNLIKHYLNKQCPVTRRSAAVIKQAIPRVEYLDAPFILRGAINVMVACFIVIFLYICSIM